LNADDAIKYMYDQSLVEIKKHAHTTEEQTSEHHQTRYFLSLHDLIHQLINEIIPMDDKKALLETATEVLLGTFSGTPDDFKMKISKEPIHLLHAQKLCEKAKQVNYTSAKLLQLKICIFECLMCVLRDFEGSKTYIEEIAEELKQW